ncbi:Mitogen-activated protein kinase kinase kinase YODA [Colletotrichum sp. SAR 10_76]|nr:Mitogen-activated protein kinase kinase kinase YODA [Colletotrichum sp. SAR 10_76]
MRFLTSKPQGFHAIMSKNADHKHSETDESGPESDGPETLGDQLLVYLVESKFDSKREFLPEGYIDEVISHSAIQHELFFGEKLDSDNKSLIDFIHDHAKKVFATAYCALGSNAGSSLLDTMDYFRRLNFTDRALPINDIQKADKTRKAKTKIPFPFDFSEDSRLQHTDGTPAHIAIKEILTTDDDEELQQEVEQNFKVEADALSDIASLKHNHIIERIAAITRGENRYFMFQWADGGNLRDFWKSHPWPELNANLVRESISQLRGLADALAVLHNYKGEGNYRHGDLKPENILRFQDKTFLGTLKIADLGLAKRHTEATDARLGSTTTRYGTARYEPPEAITNKTKARSRLYDVWSLGCIMLEYIIWLLYGYTGVRVFTEALLDDTGCFYRTEKDGNQTKAEVHPIVVDWMNEISKHPQCSSHTAIRTLLDLVRDRLLVVTLPPGSKTTSHISSAVVSVTLADTSEPPQAILDFGDGNEEYLFANNKISKGPGIDFHVLPDTFKDAVTITRELNIRYLWIDSLCIIQGPDGDFTEQSKHMEDVFSSAYCVLAASRAAGQCDGFLGDRVGRDYITFSRGEDEVYHVCEEIDNFQGDVIDGALNQRGWVLQERALARRTIYFTEKQTYWECGGGIRCETFTKLKNNIATFLGDPKFPEVAMSSTRGEMIYLYQMFYQQYSKLQFSKVEDRPFAIAGLEKRLLQGFATRGGYGVFDDGKGLLQRSLIWCRSLGGTLGSIKFPVEKKIFVPTWSWMAYEGGIDYLAPEWNKTEWEQQDLRSPWSADSPVQYTTDKNSTISLEATARDFDEAKAVKEHITLYFDMPDKADGRTPGLKCVILARPKTGSTTTDRMCYVLLVAPQVTKRSGGSTVFERVGVGKMPESCVSQLDTIEVKLQ